MGIHHSIRLGHAVVYTCAHRSHISRRETSNPAAGRNPQLRRASSAAHVGRSLCLHGEELSIGITRNSHGHAGHVIGNIKGMFGLSGTHRAGARALQLVVCLRIQTATIGSGSACELCQFLLHGVRLRLGRSCSRSRGRCGGRGRRRSWSLAASGYTNSQQQKKECSLHDCLIVMEALFFGTRSAESARSFLPQRAQQE